jgi:hypothetical protein
MSILACGPFARIGSHTQADAPSAIRAPLFTQGDWRGTEEGNAELRAAEARIAAAVGQGNLPAGTRLKHKNNDIAVIVVPFRDWASAVAASEPTKRAILAATGAALQNNLTLPRF